MTKEKLEIVETLSASLMEFVFDQPGSNGSAFALVTHGAGVNVALELENFDTDSGKKVASELEGLKFEGKGQVLDGISKAAELLNKDDVPRRKAIVAVTASKVPSKSLKKSLQAASDAVMEGDAPISVFPVVLDFASVDLDELKSLSIGTGSFPIFAESVEDADDSFQEMKESFSLVGGQAMKVTVTPAKGVKIIKVSGGEAKKPDADGAIEVQMSDLLYLDWRQLDFLVEVPAGTKDLQLLSADVKYFDVAEFRTGEKGPVEQLGLRSTQDTLEERKEARGNTEGKLREAQELLESKDTPAAVVAIAEAIAIVNVTIGDDPVIQEMLAELEEVKRLLEEAIAAKKGSKVSEENPVVALEKVIDLQKAAAPRDVVAPPPPPPPAVVDEPVVIIPAISVKPQAIPPKLEFELVPDIKDLSHLEQDVSVLLKIRAPENPGVPIDGEVVVLLDTSAGVSEEDFDLGKNLVVELLIGLSKRKGRRGVQILTYSEDVRSILVDEDLNPNSVNDAIDTVNGLTTGGKSDLSKGLAEGVLAARKEVQGTRKLLQDTVEKSQRSVLWWVVGSAPDAGEVNSELIFNSTMAAWAGSNITVFPFVLGTDITELDITLVDALALETNGVEYFIDSQESIKLAVEEAPRWFDSTFAQNLRVAFSPMSVASISDVSGPMFVRKAVNGEHIMFGSDIAYGEEFTVVVTLSLRSGIGTRKFLRIGGTYNIRSQEVVEPMFFVGKRALKRTVRERGRIRGKTSVLMGDARDRLIENNPGVSVVVVARAEAIVNVSPAKDDEVIQDILGEIVGIKGLLDDAIDTETPDPEKLLQISNAMGDFKKKVTADQKKSEDPVIVTQAVTAPESSDEDQGVNKTRLAITLKPEFEEYLSTDETMKATLVLEAPDQVALSHPVSLSLVLDASEGMTEELMQLARDVISDLITGLNVNDVPASVGLVSYGGESSVVAPITRLVDESVENLLEALSGVSPSGPSEMLNGITLGLKQQAAVVGKQRRAVIVLSGTEPSEAGAEEGILREIERFRSGPQSPITVLSYAVGFDGPDVTLMEAMADSAGGVIYFLESEEDVGFTVQDTIAGLTDAAVHEIGLEFLPSPGVSLIDIENHRGSITKLVGGWTIKIADIFFGEKRSLIISLNIASVRGASQVMKVNVKYFDAVAFDRFVEPSIPLAIDKVVEEVMTERNRVRTEAADSIDEASTHVAEEEVPEAETVIEEAMVNVDESPYQDDVVVSETREELKGVLEMLEQPITPKTFNRLSLLTESLREPANRLIAEAMAKNATTPGGADEPEDKGVEDESGEREDDPDAGCISVPRLWVVASVGLLLVMFV